MKKRFRTFLRGNSEAGYSVIETTVALAILVTVLVPLAAFILQLLTAKQARQEIEAYLLAQEVMEETLTKEAYTPLDTLYRDGRWQVQREIYEHASGVGITIGVQRSNNTLRSVTFSTFRTIDAGGKPLN